MSKSLHSIHYLIVSIILSAIITLFGTLGYMLIEGWNLLDSLYMTIITLTTVGYGEIHQISPGGRFFTIVLICLGVGFIFYVAGAMVTFMVEGQIREILGRRRLDQKISRLKDHYIVCGYGRIGRVLCKSLRKRPLDIVVVDNNEELVPVMDRDKILYVHGDASQEINLEKAGIRRAKVLVAALGTDTENVFLVLTARQMNPDIYIMARSSHKGTKSKLLAAGANKVESPYDIGAESMAQRILRPTVTNFLDLAFEYSRKDIQMEEIAVSPASSLINVMLKDSGIRQRFNLIIIAIKKADGSMLFNPSHEALLSAYDTVVAVGESANLIQLENILNPA